VFKRAQTLFVNTKYLNPLCPKYQTDEEEFEDTKGVIRIRISKNRPKEKIQKDKQRSTKHTHKSTDRVSLCDVGVGDDIC